MAIHIPRTSVQVQGMPVDKLIDTINNHKNASIGHLKALWDALPESLRNAVADKVEGWGEAISGSHQREFDKSLEDDEDGFEIDPSMYTEEQIKALNTLTPDELNFVLGKSDKLDGFDGTSDEYLQRAVNQVTGKPIDYDPRKRSEFDEELAEATKQVFGLPNNKVTKEDMFKYGLNPSLGFSEYLIPKRRVEAKRKLDNDLEDMKRQLGTPEARYGEN